MKNRDILALAFKNFKNNIFNSILTIICLTIIGTMILTLANFAYYFKVNIDKQTLEQLNANEVEIELFGTIGYDCYFAIDQDVANSFVSFARENKGFESYSISISTDSEVITSNTEYNFDAYIGGARMENFMPSLISGEYWSIADDGVAHIWLNRTFVGKQNVGDKIALSVNGASREFVVKGIADSEYSYIDYRFFDTERIIFYSKPQVYNDLSIIHRIIKQEKIVNKISLSKKTELSERIVYSISSDAVEVYQGDIQKNNMMLIAVVVLVVLSIMISLGCLINSLKIDIENNDKTIGIMKALGMRRNCIQKYVLFQSSFVAIISTVISTILALIIAALSLKAQLFTLMSLLIRDSISTVTIGFNMLLPIFSFAVLLISIVLASTIMLRSYFKNNSTAVLQGVVK